MNEYTDMYTAYFGFTERPFTITPNPRFLYSSERHVEAMAHLLHGLNAGGGFVQLTGEVGTGKTTVCRAALEQLPKDVDVALILNPALDATELLRAICDELRLELPLGPRTRKELVDVLSAHLLAANAAGRQTVVIIDEAQNLSPEVLEQVRLLTNLETESNKLLQIILIGQPELRQLLGRPGLRQLAQRVTARYHLMPLTLAETHGYIRHRLAVAGGNERLFDTRAVRRVFHHSAGIPRLINIVCDRALLAAVTQGKSKVNAHLVDSAAHEIAGSTGAGGVSANVLAALGALVIAVLASIGYAQWSGSFSSQGPRVESALPAPEPPAAHTPATQSPAVDTTPGAKISVVPQTAGGPESAGPPPAPAVAPPEPVRAPVREPEPPPEQPVAYGSQTISPDAPLDDPPGAVPQPMVAATRAPETPAAPTRPESAAYQLLRWWDVAARPATTDPCPAAQRAGLACFSGHSPPDGIAGLALPILVTLDIDGQAQRVLVAATANGRVELTGKSGSSSMLVADFSRLWRGDFLTLWRRPEGVNRTLREGLQGDDVRWLRGAIARANGDLPEPDPSDRFDAGLTQLVKVFQFTHGLAVDGIVGSRTLLQLSAGARRQANRDR